MKRFFAFTSLVALLIASSAPVFSQRDRLTRKADPDTVISPRDRTVQKDGFAKFETVEAVTDGDGVLIRWRMASESVKVGFLVSRVDGMSVTQISEMTVGSAPLKGGLDVYGQQYEYLDLDGGIGSTYFVEAVAMDGRRIRSQTAAASYVLDMRSAVGRSAAEKREAMLASNSSFVTTVPMFDRTDDLEDAALTETTDINAHRLVVNQPGAKIGVKTEGLYRVTLNELAAASGIFNAGNTANWQLFRQGIEQPILIGLDGNNQPYMEFYGKGIDTADSDMRIYYAIVGAPGKRMIQKLLKRTTSTAVSPTYAVTTNVKERRKFAPSIPNGDAENWWGPMIYNFEQSNNCASTDPDARPICFPLTGIDFTRPTVTITVRMQTYSTSQAPVVRVKLNGNILGEITAPQAYPPTAFSGQFTIPTSQLVEGTNIVRLTGMNPSWSLFESLSVDYSRAYASSGNRLTFPAPPNQNADLTGFSSPNIRIFDITSPDSISRITNAPVEQNGSTYTVKWKPIARAPSQTMFAVENSAVLTSPSITTNNPSNLASTVRNADMIIISHSAPDFIAAANSWANYRAGQGVDVEVVDVADVFDEFSWGSSSGPGVADFLNYAFANWTASDLSKRYVLLLGDGSHDPRNYLGLGAYNYVPIKWAPANFDGETASDEAMIDTNSDGLAEMAVGRVPGRDATYLNTVLNKTIAYEAAPALRDPNRGVVLAYDRPIGYDFRAISQHLANQLPGAVPKTYVSLGLPPPGDPMAIDPQGHANLVTAVNTGPYLVNWTGHGAQPFWGTAAFLHNSNTVDLNNGANQSIFTMLTCLNGSYTSPANNDFAIAEMFIKSPTMGGPVSWASTGKTTADVQTQMATRFFGQVGLGSFERMGDYVRDAKLAIPFGPDVRFSWVLFGDPMLKIR